jgi:hypothetical protein
LIRAKLHRGNVARSREAGSALRAELGSFAQYWIRAKLHGRGCSRSTLRVEGSALRAELRSFAPYWIRAKLHAGIRPRMSPTLRVELVLLVVLAKNMGGIMRGGRKGVKGGAFHLSTDYTD